MRAWKDHYVKSFLETVLGPLGKADPQHEVAAADAQWIDVWFEPDPRFEVDLKRLGWLGRISARICLFESFSEAPTDKEVRGCLRKLLTKQHRRELEAEQNQEQGPPLPTLWVISQ